MIVRTQLEVGFVAKHYTVTNRRGCIDAAIKCSRVQSVEECLTESNLEQVSCPRLEVCECLNLGHLMQCRGFGMFGQILHFGYRALIEVVAPSVDGSCKHTPPPGLSIQSSVSSRQHLVIGRLNCPRWVLTSMTRTAPSSPVNT
ncbi:hypothetical protein TNCV_3414131 [Trichonephila clavipes]|uniref:Uncharacterized protein n=1 Tax=Trichonephila clavipes TaxID=2585209 RepID=A0A8X6UV94_TRICX|nr:hypothetical protein TNCV_3414131 [Trichonephila clavipes]